MEFIALICEDGGATEWLRFEADSDELAPAVLEIKLAARQADDLGYWSAQEIFGLRAL